MDRNKLYKELNSSGLKIDKNNFKDAKILVQK